MSVLKSGSRVLRSLAMVDSLRMASSPAASRYLERSYHCCYTTNQDSFFTANRSFNVRFSPRDLTQDSFNSHQTRHFFSNKSEPENAEKKEGTPTEEVSEQEKALMSKISELESQNEVLLDKYKRSLADFENLRNRMNKQVADAKIFGIQSFCKDLLDVADVLERAVGSISDDTLKTESQYLRDMHQGLSLTQQQMLKVFERHGLVQENPLGQKFDPNRHDALFQIPAPDKEPNTVLDVQKVGYILQGRTIRPAAVGVSKK